VRVQNEGSKSCPLALLAAVLFGLIIVFHLGNALAGKSLFRAIHLGTALEYAHSPINLLRPVIVGFNATGTPTAQELPLWQAAAGLAFKFTGSTWYGWANVVSLLFFATGLWPFLQLARQYVGGRAAWWSLVFLLAQPLVVFAAGLGSDDGFCLTLTVWFLFFADRMIRRGGLRWWLPTALFACLAAVSKAPFFMAAGICSAFMLLLVNARSVKSWLMLAGAGLAAAGVFVLWTNHCNALSALAEHPYVELRLNENPFLRHWYFGDLHTRLNPGGWLKGGWRFLHATLGSMAFVVLLLAALLRPGNRLPKLWLLAAFLTTLVFTNLVLVHWHYYLMACPAVALLCGSTLARWEDSWAQPMPQAWLRTALAGLALALSAADGLMVMKISIYYDGYPQAMGALIAQHTLPTDKLILFGGDWGGEELFRSNRKGFYVYAVENTQGAATTKGLKELLANADDLHHLQSLGYNKLVLISESPARFAAVAVNPGSQRRRECYPAAISPAVDAWPVVYRSEDLLIRDIPKE
jgi:hypothetical protein